MFTPAVQAEQKARGSRDANARMVARGAPDGLGEDEIAFLTSRTSLYIATVSETGWPYVQHRGGPRGFLKVLDAQTIGFADYRGNRQYVSTGNLKNDDRVSLFAMDYPRKARLKLIGHATLVDADAAPDLAQALASGEQGKVEHLVTIRIAAFDWNCPQFITPRFDTAEIAALVAPELERLETENARLADELASLRETLKKDT
ncbi:pyridoxamine 5'-phosphate oxidase family protein [uncultured Roseobacter sp.]|uniref:pyridoxamine 5'-phosphate oxidase family protein n=1 Tax=uncultured Roseobacter sp. TaxID=114847 RepID=UPI00262B682A|nr:pyridoxamine 5'-phosphate oxidase family protein [uncultured Roseobacter sp.]